MFFIFRDYEYVWNIYMGWAKKYWRNKARVDQSLPSLGGIVINFLEKSPNFST